jgi:hypothetical protein
MPACPVGPTDRTGVVIFFACLDLERKSSLINRLIYMEEKTEVLEFNTIQAAGVVPNFSGQILGVLFSDHCQF